MKKLWMTVLFVFLVGLTVPLSAKADEKKPVLMWTNMYLHEGKFSPLDNLKDRRTEWRSTDPSVVEVYPNGNVLAKKENVEIGVGTGWNRISIDDLILTESDIVVEVQSWGENWANGQDICFDDIKIMACSSPALDLTFTKYVLICLR